MRNDTKTWMFGTTSALSKEIIKNLDNPICFGRHNVDYNDPDNFLQTHFNKDEFYEKNLSINMYVNVAIDVPKGLHTDTHESFMKLLHDVSITIYFFYRLLKIIKYHKKPVKVCYITSSSPNAVNRLQKLTSNEKESIFINNEDGEAEVGIGYNVFIYNVVRSLQQFAYLSRHSKFCRTIGVSPSRLSNENIAEYGRIIAGLLDKDINDEQWEKIYDLSTGMWFEWSTVTFEPSKDK